MNDLLFCDEPPTNNHHEAKQKHQVVDNEKVQKTLGMWYFDRKAKMRRYVALTGVCYTGHVAMVKSAQDKISEKNPSKSIRRELEISMRKWAVNRQASIEQLQPLSSWGIPKTVVERYSAKGVITLFPWQVDALLVKNGIVLEENSTGIGVYRSV